MTALNLFTTAAQIAVDRTFGGPQRAARIAAAYIDWAMSNSEDVINAPDFAAHVAKQYMERDAKCYEDAKGEVDAVPPRGVKCQEASGKTGNSSTSHCLTNAMGKCTNKACKFARGCPFCLGNNRSCTHTEGNYLDWHLEVFASRSRSRPETRAQTVEDIVNVKRLAGAARAGR